MPSAGFMPILQLESITRFSALSSGCCAITPTQLLFLAGFCWIHCATVPAPWISPRQKPAIGDALYEMPVIS